MWQKRIIFAIGVVVIFFLLMALTGKKIWPYLLFGAFAYFIYKNNR